MTKLILTLENDSDAENPCDEDGWKLISFQQGNLSYQIKERYVKCSVDGKFTVGADIGIEKKLQVGTAFVLDYSSHGPPHKWFLGDKNRECRYWEPQCYGILLWEWPVDGLGAKTYQDREKDAAAFLKLYTEWSNGHAIWFELEDENGKEIARCGNLYDEDGGLQECINEFLDDDDEIVEVKGKAAWLAEYLTLKVKLPKPKRGR